MHLKMTFFLCSLALLGCVGTNQSIPHSDTVSKSEPHVKETYTYITYQREVDGTVSDTGSAQPRKAGEGTCKPFVLPDVKPLPEIPKINSRKMTDAAIAEILVEHVEQLRSYIDKSNKAIHQAYHDQLNTCGY